MGISLCLVLLSSALCASASFISGFNFAQKNQVQGTQPKKNIFNKLPGYAPLSNEKPQLGHASPNPAPPYPMSGLKTATNPFAGSLANAFPKPPGYSPLQERQQQDFRGMKARFDSLREGVTPAYSSYGMMRASLQAETSHRGCAHTLLLIQDMIAKLNVIRDSLLGNVQVSSHVEPSPEQNLPWFAKQSPSRNHPSNPAPPEELTNYRHPDPMASFKHVVSPPEEPTNYRRPDPMASFKHVVSPPEEPTNNRRPDPMASFNHVVSPPEEPTNYRHPDPMASFKHVVSPPEELTNNRRPDLMASFKHVVSPPEEPTNYRRPDPMASFKHVVSPPEELTNNRRPDPMASFKHVVSPPEEPTNYRHPDPMASFNHVVSQEPERRLEKGSFHGRRDEDLSRLPQSEGFNVNNFALVGSQGQESVSSSPKELHNLFSEKEQELASSGQSSLPEELNSLAREATGQLSQFQQTLDSLQQNLSQAFQHGDGSSQSEKGDGETEPERDTEQDESTSTERPVTKRRQSNARRGSSQKGFLSKLREKTSAMKEKVSKGQGMRRHRRQRSLSGNFLDNITQSISKAKDSLMGLFDNLGSALKRRP